jgi:hypothetical protein
MATLYETDFYAWTLEQASRLRRMAAERENLDVDVENIAEEIESMGRSNRTQLVNRLAQLDEHLMKLAFSPSWEPRSMWRNSARGQRHSIAKLLRQNPSLRRELPDALAEAHEDALRVFDEEKLIQLTMPELPGLCPFDLDDLLRDDWWPEPRDGQ